MEYSVPSTTADTEMLQDEEMKSYEQIVEETQLRTGQVTKQDFKMLTVIGKGAYGKVLLVKKKEKDPTKQADGELYAMKVLKKSEILRRN